MADYGLTDDGFTAPRAADFLAEIRDTYDAETGITHDYERDQILGQLTALEAISLGNAAEALQAVYDARRLTAATGQQLDDLCALVGVTRLPATYSAALLTLSGTAGTVIPSSRLVEDVNHVRWALDETATIGGGGTVSALAHCVSAGAVHAGIGEISQIVETVSGWTGVTNAAAAVVGDDLESDAALKRRRARSLAGSGRSVDAMRTDILALDGIQAGIVLENDTATNATVAGVTLAPHSVCVVVYPNTLTDAQKTALVQTIFDHLPVGIYTNGNVSAQYLKTDGTLKTIRWRYASTTTVNFATVVTLLDGYVLADVQQPILDAVQEYFDGLTVGDAVRRLQLTALIADIEGVKAVPTLTLNGVAADVEPTLTQLAIQGTSTATL